MTPATTTLSPAAVFRLAALLAASLGAAACSTTPPFGSDPLPAWGRGLAPTQADAEPVSPTLNAPPAAAISPAQTEYGFYRPGSGRLVGTPGQGIADAVAEAGEIKLNFQNANLLEVVKVILGDMLGETYVVDPRVQGVVTMQTSQPLPRSALLPTLELLLRMNEAALIMDGKVRRVVPLANAVTGVQAPQLGDSTLPLPRGYSVRVVPLRYVAAEEMAQILDPFVAGSNNLLRTDRARNVIILAGSGEDMGRLLETVRVFDVDRMKGMSVAMFTPDLRRFFSHVRPTLAAMAYSQARVLASGERRGSARNALRNVSCRQSSASWSSRNMRHKKTCSSLPCRSTSPSILSDSRTPPASHPSCSAHITAWPAEM